jgi:hypothetical protein
LAVDRIRENGELGHDCGDAIAAAVGLR